MNTPQVELDAVSAIDNPYHELAERARVELLAASQALARAEALFRSIRFVHQFQTDDEGPIDKYALLDIGIEMTAQYATRADDEVEYFEHACRSTRGGDA